MTRKDPQKPSSSRRCRSADGKTFIKLTLGKFRGEGEASKAVATLVALKDVPHLKVVTSFARKDDTKTFSINDGINAVKALIGETYLSATLFSAERDDADVQQKARTASDVRQADVEADRTRRAIGASRISFRRIGLISRLCRFRTRKGASSRRCRASIVRSAGSLKSSMGFEGRQTGWRADAVIDPRYRIGERLPDVRALRSPDDGA
jgi:hypothetical protein